MSELKFDWCGRPDTSACFGCTADKCEYCYLDYLFDDPEHFEVITYGHEYD